MGGYLVHDYYECAPGFRAYKQLFLLAILKPRVQHITLLGKQKERKKKNRNVKGTLASNKKRGRRKSFILFFGFFGFTIWNRR